jgi:SAM-dependent methyltransferase
VQRPPWAPQGIDLTRPSAARMYDYYLGGSHNFAIDREAAEQAIAMWPDLPIIMQANRAFLRRAVRFLVAQGIRQFLDIGSGIPTVGNVHEVAQQAAPESRVVYVDIDPVAVAHSRAILSGNTNTAVVHGDARDPDRLLAQPDVQHLIDFTRPVAVLLVALLHFIPDDEDAYRLVGRLRDLMAPGSYLVISHASFEGRPTESESHTQLYSRTSTPMMMRARQDIARFFAGLHLVEPGVVYLPLWRPESPEEVDEHPERFTGFAGVGRKE